MAGKQFIMTSPKLNGAILFKFHLNGLLRSIETPQLEEVQYDFIFRNKPWNIDQIKKYKTLKGVRLKEVPEDLSFHNFWESYGNKVGSKMKAKKLWEMLSRTEQIQALVHIPKYKHTLMESGTNQAYPTSYLNQRYFDV